MILRNIVFKSYDSEDDSQERIIEGIASSNAMDDDGEVIEQSGMDISRFNWVTWGHGRTARHTIGEVIEKSKTEKGLFVKVKIYKGFPPADEVWELIKTLERNKSKNKLGFSIEGKVLERQGKKITKCKIDRVSLDLTGINPEAFASIAKAFGSERLSNLYDYEEKLSLVEKINKSLNEKLKKIESNYKNTTILDINNDKKEQKTMDFTEDTVEQLAKSLFNQIKADEANRKQEEDTLVKGMEGIFTSKVEEIEKSFNSKIDELTKSYEARISEKEGQLTELQAKVEELSKEKGAPKGVTTMKSYLDRFSTDKFEGKVLDIRKDKKEILKSLFDVVAKSTSVEDANEVNRIATNFLVTGELEEKALTVLDGQKIRVSKED